MPQESPTSQPPTEQSSKAIYSSPIPRIRQTVAFDTQGLRIETLINNIGMGKTKIYELIKEGKFPAPRKIGRMSIWNSREVQAWIDERLNGSAA